SSLDKLKEKEIINTQAIYNLDFYFNRKGTNPSFPYKSRVTVDRYENTKDLNYYEYVTYTNTESENSKFKKYYNSQAYLVNSETGYTYYQDNITTWKMENIAKKHNSATLNIFEKLNEAKDLKFEDDKGNNIEIVTGTISATILDDLYANGMFFDNIQLDNYIIKDFVDRESYNVKVKAYLDKETMLPLDLELNIGDDFTKLLEDKIKNAKQANQDVTLKNNDYSIKLHFLYDNVTADSIIPPKIITDNAKEGNTNILEHFSNFNLNIDTKTKILNEVASGPWDKGEFMLDGIEYKLPLTYNDLIENGITIVNKADLNKSLKPGKDSFGVQVKTKTGYAGIHFVNNTKKTMKMIDCPVTGINISNSSLYNRDFVDFELPEGIRINDRLAKLTNTYTKPYATIESADQISYLYFLDKNVLELSITVDKVTDRIKDIDLDTKKGIR
ncbi:hypothetical protein LJB88_05035, partial [Erysipelotrichaceae bacterium OttesenSCG-928-M19]|nr:hypothetical protein [Erysipelotrichaceae bacterium OttesenSCG-928-M19]